MHLQQDVFSMKFGKDNEPWIETVNDLMDHIINKGFELRSHKMKRGVWVDNGYGTSGIKVRWAVVMFCLSNGYLESEDDPLHDDLVRYNVLDKWFEKEAHPVNVAPVKSAEVRAPNKKEEKDEKEDDDVSKTEMRTIENGFLIFVPTKTLAKKCLMHLRGIKTARKKRMVCATCSNVFIAPPSGRLGKIGKRICPTCRAKMSV